jgi:ankyrin repeat protein
MIVNKELFKAIDRENLLLIRTEIQNGAEPNEKNGYGDTAMHFSITKGNLEILKLLLELGGDINAKNQEGVSLLLQSIGEENSLNCVIQFNSDLQNIRRYFQQPKNKQ